MITIDFHATQGFFNIPVDHLTALDLFYDYIVSRRIENPIIVSPDMGRASTAEKLANHLDYPYSIIVKKRTEDQATITEVIGDVRNRDPRLLKI